MMMLLSLASRKNFLFFKILFNKNLVAGNRIEECRKIVENIYQKNKQIK